MAPFSSDEAKILLANELGRPLADLFEDPKVFDKPIAAASIGQVMTITIAPGVLRGYIDVQFSSAWGKVCRC